MNEDTQQLVEELQSALVTPLGPQAMVDLITRAINVIGEKASAQAVALEKNFGATIKSLEEVIVKFEKFTGITAEDLK